MRTPEEQPTPTGQEIRVKCAEAMGYVLKHCRFHHATTWHSPEGICLEGNTENVLPKFEQSCDAAMELVEALRVEAGWNCDMLFYHGEWEVIFGNDTANARTRTGRAATLPLAICLAFLATKGLEP